MNADNGKLIKEKDFDTPDKILWLLHLTQTKVDKECYFTDDDFVGVKSEYISNNVIDTDKGRIYQIYFKFEINRVKVI